MISSVMPSVKYSSSGSELIQANGRTAIDGAVGRGGEATPGAAEKPPGSLTDAPGPTGNGVTASMPKARSRAD